MEAKVDILTGAGKHIDTVYFLQVPTRRKAAEQALKRGFPGAMKFRWVEGIDLIPIEKKRKLEEYAIMHDEAKRKAGRRMLRKAVQQLKKA